MNKHDIRVFHEAHIENAQKIEREKKFNNLFITQQAREKN